MARSETHERLLHWTYDLIVTSNRWKVDEGRMTEDELLDHAEERITYLQDVPFSVFTKRLLAEIPTSYFGNA